MHCSYSCSRLRWPRRAISRRTGWKSAVSISPYWRTSNEKTARRIADQFERMRSVFHVALPHLSLDNGSPIIVLAIKYEGDFRALEPQSLSGKRATEGWAEFFCGHPRRTTFSCE